MFFFINVCKNIERQQQIVKIYQFIIITQEYANNEVFKKKILETITIITRMYIQFLCYQAKYTKIKN